MASEEANRTGGMRPIIWTMPMDLEDRERLARTRQRFTDFADLIGDAGGAADAVARSFGRVLAGIALADLPPPAQLQWAERIARPLKTDAMRPIPERAVGAIRSWPSARIADLVAAVAEIETVLVDTENEALNVAIYVEISRTYS